MVTKKEDNKAAAPTIAEAVGTATVSDQSKPRAQRAVDIEAARAEVMASIQAEGDEIWAKRDPDKPGEAQKKISALNAPEEILRRTQEARERVKLQHHLASFEESVAAQVQSRGESKEAFDARVKEMRETEMKRLGKDIERLGLNKAPKK